MEKLVDESESMSVSDKKSSLGNIDAVAQNPTSMMKTTTQGSTAPHQAADNREEEEEGPFIGGKTVVPTKCGSGGANEVAPGSVSMKRVRGGVLADENPSPNLQPFDAFVPSGATFISPGLSFPFTHAQWQELARQAMIYKYMISSVPVPHNLLTTALGSTAPPSGKYPRNGSDLEPGRCKRTDGKKWRCSRDVAPQQKYCERHLHRGRPRSRKRVEANKTISNDNSVDEDRKKTSLRQRPKLPISPANSTHQQHDSNLLFDAGTDLTISPSCYKAPAITHRNLGLTMMGTEDNPMEEPNIESGNVGLLPLYGSSMFYDNQDCYYYHAEQQHQQPMDLLSHSKLPISEIESPISFWAMNSNANHSEPSSLSPPNYHESLLSLSLGDALGYQEMGRIHGNDFNRSEDSWRTIGPNSCWEPFASGGPLAEALQPNSSSNPTSPPYEVATTVSSPSGVLQRGSLFSHSDNSACNSPTLGGAHPLEAAFRWWLG